ncbi:MAG TPA: helix-turn-helix domain-containing protein [Solirubrobacteraceae bacterium]|nr:helix-turn-helix domain-containing protein [Solirubrobacteraceae bacterium]
MPNESRAGAEQRWPPQRSGMDLARRPLRSAPLSVYLLDADEELAEEFDVRMRLAVRQTATARVLSAECGRCDLIAWLRSVGMGPGLLVLDGIIAVETRVGGRTAMELIGAGDLLQPPGAAPDELLERSEAWRALTPARIAVLDEDFADRMRPWPEIGRALLRRANQRIVEIDMLRAIASQPRLEVRLVLLLWHLASRWGRVEPDGIRVSLPLTHRLLGELVAAERPSVSHALTRLAHAQLVVGAPGDWHLRGTLERHLDSLIERPLARQAG